MATEKRLIDATPIIDECKECSTIEWNKSVYTTWAEAEEDFMQRLLDAPTVDAVPVVRCEYCVWCEQGEGYEPYCNHPTDGMHDVQLDDYCSYGERKDND